MRLQGKSAVIYGANHPAGASVARAFAKEGATVFLAGRSTGRLQPVAREILNAGGAVDVAQVDPSDSESVSEHLHQVVVKHGSVDVSLNLAFLGVAGASRLCNLTEEQFAAATFTRVRSNFVTTAAAAREMSFQGRGIILATALPGGSDPEGKMAGQTIGSAAIGELCDQLRADVGPFGVHVAYLAEVPATEEELVQNLIGVVTTIPATTPTSRARASTPAVPTRFSAVEASEGTATG